MISCNKPVVFISSGELDKKIVHRSKILDASQTRLNVFDWFKRVRTSLNTSASVEIMRYNPLFCKKRRRAQAGRSAHARPPHAPAPNSSKRLLSTQHATNTLDDRIEGRQARDRFFSPLLVQHCTDQNEFINRKYSRQTNSLLLGRYKHGGQTRARDPCFKS